MIDLSLIFYFFLLSFKHNSIVKRSKYYEFCCYQIWCIFAKKFIKVKLYQERGLTPSEASRPASEPIVSNVVKTWPILFEHKYYSLRSCWPTERLLAVSGPFLDLAFYPEGQVKQIGHGSFSLFGFLVVLTQQF